MQPLEWYEKSPLPERYELLNSATRVKFSVSTYSFDAENQALMLRKMRDAKGQGQNSPPEEALEILSALHITGK